MPESQSTELVVRSSGDLEAVKGLAAALLDPTKVAELVQFTADDPAEIQREILAQILGAETEDEVEAVGKATGWRELAERHVAHHALDAQDGVPVEIRGFRWRESDYEEGAPFYFIVSAVRLDTGEHVILTTGSANILAQLCRLAELGAIPGAVRIATETEKPTAKGYYPMWLRSPEIVRRDRLAAFVGDALPTGERPSEAAMRLSDEEQAAAAGNKAS